jgi:hypothetical protein
MCGLQVQYLQTSICSEVDQLYIQRWFHVRTLDVLGSFFHYSIVFDQIQTYDVGLTLKCGDFVAGVYSYKPQQRSHHILELTWEYSTSSTHQSTY